MCVVHVGDSFVHQSGKNWARKVLGLEEVYNRCV